MKTYKQFGSREKKSSIINGRLFILMALFVLFPFGNLAYGQYTGDLPAMATPIESQYTHDRTSTGHYFLMNYNGTPLGDKASYSLLFGDNKELLRLSQNGTLSLLGSPLGTGKYPSLNFYTQSREFMAAINAANNNLNLTAKNQMKFSVNTSHEILSLGYNKVSIYENLEMLKKEVNLRFGLDDTNVYGWIGAVSSNGCYFGAGGHANMYMDENYHVYIGPSANEATAIRTELKNKYRLFVYGGVLSEDLAIAPKASWADFVFGKSYKLRPLIEVERFINVNKHLPDIPSAKEVAENGYSQHDLNKALLQKIEELTLYIIEQQKRIKELEISTKHK